MYGQVTLPLTPIAPKVDLVSARSAGPPATVKTAPGTVTFTIGTASATLSIQSPSTVAGAQNSVFFNLNPPAVFGLNITANSLRSVQARFFDSGGCLVFGGPGFVNAMLSSSCTVDRLENRNTDAGDPGVWIYTVVQVAFGDSSLEYDVHFWWTTDSCAATSSASTAKPGSRRNAGCSPPITMIQPSEISNDRNMPYNQTGGAPLNMLVFGKGLSSVTQAVLCGSDPIPISRAADTIVSIPVQSFSRPEGPCEMKLSDSSNQIVATNSDLLYVSSILPRVEIHQGVRIPCDGDTPCVAEHRTVVRVRLSCESPGDCNKGKEKSTGILRVVKDGAPYADIRPREPVDVFTPFVGSLASIDQQKNGQDALLFDIGSADEKQNFVFPPGGSYDFYFVINARKPQSEPDLGPIPGVSETHLSRSLTAQPFKLSSGQAVTIGVLVDPFRPRGNKGLLPDATGPALSSFGFLRATYPISQSSFVVDLLSEPYTFLSPEEDNFTALNDLRIRVNAWRSKQEATPQFIDKLFYYSNLASTAGYSNCSPNQPRLDLTSSNGRSYTTPPDLLHYWDCSTPISLFKANDPALEAVVAHEFGHHNGLGDTYKSENNDGYYANVNFPNIGGCFLSGCSVQDGFIDPILWTVSVNPATLSGVPAGYTKLDFMGNANRPLRWVDQRTWDLLYPKLNANSNAKQSPKRRPKDASSAQTSLIVSGTLSPDGAAQFSPFEIVPSADFVRPTAAGDYSVELQDASGAVLQSTSFSASFAYGHSYVPRSTPFTVALPYPAQTGKIVLKASGSPIASRTVPQHSPTVRLISPSGGETVDGTFTIAWAGSHPDGLPLTYSIFYSTDNGASWTPLAHDIKDTTLTWDSTRSPGSTNVLIGVSANDGVNTTDDVMQTAFTVASKGPTASISAPDDGTTVIQGQPVTLQGYGYDLQDGLLPNSALTFSSDRDGELGSGSPLVLSALSVGTHNITLTVKNSAGATATDSITLTVARAAAAPQISSVNPTQGTPGTAITLTGSGFAATAAQNVVMFGNTAAQVTAATPTQILTLVPAGLRAGSVPITVTVAGVASNTVSFTVLATTLTITLSSTSLDFGNVNVGQTPGTLPLTVTNTGAVAVTVTAKTSAPFSVAPSSLALAVGQSGTLTLTFTPTAAGAAAGSLVISIGSPNDPPPVSLIGNGVIPATGTQSISRTFVHHEITRFTKEVRFSNGGMPVLSSGGGRVVYAHAPGDETDARYNHIFVVNADGSGQREVDVYKQNCFCGAIVDISADGNTVVSTDGIELRVASATGSAGRRLITNREISYARISPKGDKVFFINRRGDASATDPTTERGLYVINTDGSGLKQIAGPNGIAPLLATTTDKVFPFSTNGWSLDVSADGAMLVFGVAAPGGERILAVKADGTGLRQVLGPVSFINHAAISGDGTKVGYDVIPPPCCSTPNEVGVVNADGTNRKSLASSPPDIGSANRMEMSGDGAQLLYGSTSYLYAANGSGLVQLSARGGYYSSDKGPLITDGFGQPTMNSLASRFLYITRDDAGIPQLATLDINPSALGDAPSITAPALMQSTIALNGASQSLVTASIATSNTVSRVSAAVLNAGIPDPNVNAPVMLDDGTNGDQVAGDGTYSGRITANCCAVPGPKTVRVKAEVRDAANRRHATAIEFSGLTVVSTTQ